MPIRICLWFDNQAEEAVDFYASIFKNFGFGKITKFSSEGFEFHGKPEGSVMTIEFSINGNDFIALNGGPYFKFNEAVSLVIECENQEEIDYYWSKLSDGGSEGQCGWLKDKYGLSWQITPRILNDLLFSSDYDARKRAENLMFKMKKLDVNKLIEAFNKK